MIAAMPANNRKRTAALEQGMAPADRGDNITRDQGMDDQRRK